MDSTEHFNQVAKDYDYWKKKNWYYYQNLKALYKSLIPPGSKIWEIGCGTGDILASLEPSSGYGTDISQGMINLAQRKHKGKSNLKFETLEITDMINDEKRYDYDYIIIADVLEHIEDLPDFLSSLRRVVKPNAKIIISVANPFWKSVLMLAEKLKMKMPEGPHKRLPIRENEAIFLKNNLKIMNSGYRFLIPKKIPGSDWINSIFYKNKILSKFGFITFWILKKK